ncbi:Coatomer subunit gamma-2, partial [Trichinella pseudospiralis]
LKTMLALKKDKKDEESHSGAYFASSCDRTTVLQEARQFNETPINARKCCTTLTKLLYLISQGEQLSRKEATDAFFSITKLWQSNDVVLRRLVYLTIKELASLADDVIIVTSSLTKDMTGKEDIYRASAIRALCKVTDSTMLQAIERYMKQAIVDRIPAVASAALVSTLYLMKKNPDCIRRWTSEIQEAANSDNPMIQFHGLAVYYEMRKNDRLSVVQLVQKYSKQCSRSAFALCYLIRIALKLIEEDEKGRDTGTLLDFLESCLRHKSEMVVYEAASALLRLPNITSKELSSAISVLQMFCSSSKAALRFAAVRTLSSVAGIYPAAVAACNVDLEQLISDQNRSIATLAITTLLKTGAESSVDRLMKQISSFVSEISDEFKVVVIDAVRSLCVRYPKKSTILLSFLSNMLRDEGGFLYKKAIIDTIVWIIEENDEAKEPGLVYLCEFIEDCEHVTLATKVLNLLGKEGPKCSNPRKYIRFIFNRVLLEPPPVRAVAVTAMAKFGVCQSLRADVVTLLQRCLLDSDDEVRDRATFYSVLFSTNNLKLYEELITGGLDVSPSLLVCALREYCAFSSSKFEPFNLNSSREEIYEEQLHQIEQFAKFGPLFKSSAPLELTESEVEIAVSCVQHMFLEHIVFQLEDVELGFSMQVKPMKMNFNTIWEDLDGNVEVACELELAFLKTMFSSVFLCFISIIGVPDDDGRFVIEGCASDRDWLPFWKNDPDPYLEIRHTCRLSYGETFHIEGPLIKFLPDNTDFGAIFKAPLYWWPMTDVEKELIGGNLEFCPIGRDNGRFITQISKQNININNNYNLMTKMASAYYVQSNPDDQVNRCLASQTGLTLRQVEFLRREFSKHGRNPMPEMLEILAVENGFEENKVKRM